ncbi:unnamed protein product [Chilo suppressalis]|uniref:Anamorsin N-terminal domain-containing protein n=1 Tax=Chilo suppressalis TaxID=168631 RepID=A0ABN8L5G8_CHISP|nr:unnamed protein product [Chilo suppressalis]
MNGIKEGDNILIIWKNNDQNDLSAIVNELKKLSKKGQIVLENADMISDSSRQHSSFDVVMSNWLAPYGINHTDNLLAIIIKLLKPSGKLLLKTEIDLISALKLNGFINVCRDDNIFTAEKPKFEVGSKATLKLGNKPAVWKIDDTVEAQWNGVNDDEVIDDSLLLDEDDLKKPDQQSLRGGLLPVLLFKSISKTFIFMLKVWQTSLRPT